MHSAGKDELRVILEPDARVLADLRLLIKTEKYIKRKQGTSISAIEGQILQTKGAQNIDREKELIERVKASVGKSALIINAADITSSSQDALARVTDGFQDLISRTYTQLKLLGRYDLQRAAGRRSGQPGQRAVRRRRPAASSSRRRKRCCRSSCARRPSASRSPSRPSSTRFTAKPYGWDLASIEVLIAFLIGTSKVTLTVDGNVLKRSEVATALRNTQKHAHAVVAPQKTFDERKVAAFRKFCTDFFDEGNTPKDPLELARHGADKLKAKRDELKATVTGSKYPFVAQLSAPIDLLDQVVGKPDDWYLTDFNLGDDLLDAKESTIDPIQRVPQRRPEGHLRRGRRSARPPTAATSATCRPAATPRYERRWKTRMPSAATRWRSSSRPPTSCALRSTASSPDNRTEVVEAIEGRKAEIEASAFYAKATSDAQESVLRRVDQTIARVRAENQIALIRETGSSFEESVYPALLDQLADAQPTRRG